MVSLFLTLFCFVLSLSVPEARAWNTSFPALCTVFGGPLHDEYSGLFVRLIGKACWNISTAPPPPQQPQVAWIVSIDAANGSIVSNFTFPPTRTFVSLFYSNSIQNSDAFEGRSSRTIMFVTTQSHLLTVDVLTGTLLGERSFVWTPAGGPGSLYWVPIRADVSSSSNDASVSTPNYDEVAAFYYDEQSFPVTVNPPTYHPFASFALFSTPKSHGGVPVPEWNATYNAYVNFVGRPYYRTYHLGDPTLASSWYVVFINSTQFPYTNTGYSIQITTGKVVWAFEMDNTTAALWSTLSFQALDNDAQVVIASTSARSPYAAAAYSIVDGSFLWRNDSLSSNDYGLYKIRLDGAEECGGVGSVPYCVVGGGVYPPYDMCIFDTLTAATVFCFDNTAFQNDVCWYGQRPLLGAHSGKVIIFQGNTTMWAYSLALPWNASVRWTLNFTSFMLRRNPNYASISYGNSMLPAPSAKSNELLFVPVYAYEGAPVWSSINVILVINITSGVVVRTRELGPCNPTFVGVNTDGDVLASASYCTKNPYGTCLAMTSAVFVV